MRAEKLTALLLLFILLTAAIVGVTSVLLSPDWASLWKALIFGLLVGWLLAIFQQSGLRAAGFAVALALIYTLLFTAGLGEKVTTVVAELIRLASRIVTSPPNTEADLTSLAPSLQALSASTGVIIERVRTWVVALLTGQPSFDPVAAALVWSMLVWFIAAWAGWVVEARKNALLAALPAILLSVGILSYARRATFVLYVILGATLLLLATVQHDERERGWDRSGVAYPVWKGRQIGSTALIAAVALVLLSALVSSISFRRIADWMSVRNRAPMQQDGDLAKSLGIVSNVTATPDVFEAVRHPGLPRDHLIGSGPELSKRVVMTVAINELQPIYRGGQSLPLYWRSFTYDVYTGRGWRSSETEQSLYQANQLMQSNQAPDRILVQQVVRPIENKGGTLYVAGEPVVVNFRSEVAWRSPGDLFGIQMDSAGPYEARSLIPVIDERTLRAAGQRYPDWVRKRFLALPPDVPNRVKELAIELTASEPTPYDRARAIERYLRTIPYTLDVSRPLVSQDLVDFFLFDLQQGYCDYYASAMVVLSRAAGVPARLAIGYASGKYNLNSNRFVVTEADAHSWVEVYFPNVGWVPFEPTAARPSLEMLQGPTAEEPHDLASFQEAPGVNQTKSSSWIWLIPVGGLALVGTLGAVWVAFDRIRLRRLSQPAAALEVYRRMRRYGALLAVALEPGDTPYEFASSLSVRLQDLMRHGVGPAFGLPVIQEVHSVTKEIVLAIYRPYRLEVAHDSYILHQWQVLRWRLLLMWILKSLKSLRDRSKRRLAGDTGQSSVEVVREDLPR